MRSADIQHHQPDGAADGRVGPVARAEGIGTAIHADLPRHWPVHDDQGRGHMRRRLYPVQVEGGVASASIAARSTGA